ncbi:hypothetical protein ACFL1A_01840 [Patescibacteria group bacterium]
MDDYNDIQTLLPPESLQLISSSPISKAQKLLAASLVTQSRIYPFRYPKAKVDFLTIDVSHFLNHRVNTKLMKALGEELALEVSLFTPDLILTAPSSGNFLAFTAASYLPDIPDVIYAPKGMPLGQEGSFQTSSRSFSYGKDVKLSVSADCLKSDSKVAICDDFLDTGRTVMDLVNIVNQAKSQAVCLFFAIEKPFNGRQNLIDIGIPNEAVISLIKIDSLRPGKIKLAGFDYWFELTRK